MLKAVVELAAYGVAATLAAVCILAWAWKWGGWMQCAAGFTASAANVIMTVGRTT